MKIKGEIGQDYETRLSVNGELLVIVGMDFEIEINRWDTDDEVIVREENWPEDGWKVVAQRIVENDS